MNYIRLEKGIKTGFNVRRRLKFFFAGKNSKNFNIKQKGEIEKKLVRSWGEKRLDMGKLISWFCGTIKCIADGNYEEFIFQ